MINLVKKVNIEDYRNVYVVGDIHGCFTLLDKLIYSVGFDKERDLLISVGDLVGRGAESNLAIKYLKEDWFISAVGNHDIIFFDFYDRKFTNLYAGLDMIEYNLYQDEDWIKKLLSFKNKVSFFIEIYENGELMDLVSHAAFEMKSINDYNEMLNDFRDFNNKEVITKCLWNRGLAAYLKDNNYERYNNNINSEEYSVIVDGVRNIYTGHNIINIPLEINNIEDMANYLRLGNFYFLDTGAFFTDKDYSIGINLDSIKYGMTIYNITKNKFERICYK